MKTLEMMTKEELIQEVVNARESFESALDEIDEMKKELDFKNWEAAFLQKVIDENNVEYDSESNKYANVEYSKVY